MTVRRATFLVLLAALILGSPPGASQASDARIVGERHITARVFELTISTPAFAAPTKVQVILPVGYESNRARRWPVTYVMAGTMNSVGTFKDLIGGEKLTSAYPSILVSADSNSGYWSDWYNGGALGPPKYETFVIDQLMPLIDARFRTLADRSHRAIFGVSMGGYGTTLTSVADAHAAHDLLVAGDDGDLPCPDQLRELVRGRPRGPLIRGRAIRGTVPQAMNDGEMKIVVTTPTGHVGSRVVRLLVQAGTRPTVLLRDAARLDADLRDLVDAVEGDQRDGDVVLRATEGADAVYWVNPPTGDDDPIEAQRGLGANAARAVGENGVTRTVFQSSVGAEKRSGAGDIDGLAATEQQLDETGASVLHLRCGMFFTNLLLDPGGLEEGVLRVTWPPDQAMPWVDPRDVGDIAAARLLATDWVGRQVQAVHGPEDLSYSQVAAIVSQATGRSFRVEQISDDDMRSALGAAGLAERQVEAILGMSIGLREGFEPEDERSVLTTTPSTLAAWSYQHLR